MRAIIVDDEKHSRDVLRILLEKNCPDITVMATCNNGEAALDAIAMYDPQLLFLDIEMPGLDGFQVLEATKRGSFAVIFTTAYDHYAVQAIRHSALDYLLKPIDTAELKEAVIKATERMGQPVTKKVDNLVEMLQQHIKQSERLALPTTEGLRMVIASDILYCESNGANTNVYLRSQEKPFPVTRTMKEMEEVLEDKAFFRVHNSFLVNLSFMDKYIKGDGGEIIMCDGQRVPVSRQKKQDFLLRIEKM
ncbi:two component transcriptional regulator, LytTR family [Chitinophaga jiangningensis]|uniref:Two component transcriptional regulator, LytTR family n=1 Tax=Chitinophaga jiangningensis TaxID=1419482 RepID=A0A1M7EEC8_9BACT|nr:LytTR family DNA-binding domain-containing protein [Chitinophaga jiangningensis]SHL89980.1 two component transcriptional regulator, LytTR family [Chitinophaga jiangningensis]